MNKINFLKKKSGFTLIEVLIFIFIFAIVSLMVYEIIGVGMRVALDSKYRLGALALANERVEIIRNTKYEDIGTVDGIPSGIFLDDEDVIASGRSYHINTFAQYLDDSFDKLTPEDTAPNDYKRVKITVSWNSFNGSTKDVSLVSRFVPTGLEVGSGGGVLSVNVINSAGVGIPQAQVHIINNDISPAVSISQKTDNNGNLVFIGAQQSIYKYAISVLKNDYESVSTISPGSVSYSAIDVHASVVTGLLNTKSVVIDLLSKLKIKALDYSDNPINDLNFHLEGGRILGTNNSSVPSEIVYILDTNKKTDASGEINLIDQGPGQFFLTNIDSISEKTLVGVSPISGFEATPLKYKFALLPGEEKEVEIKFASNEVNGLLVKVLGKIDRLRINEAEVRLKNESGYDVTLGTSFDGVAFFPESGTLLEEGDYTLEVIAAGFDNYSETVSITKLTTQEVELEL